MALYSKDDYYCECLEGFTGKHCEKVHWIQMTPSSVCFGATSDSPGTFTTPSSGEVITFKLIHLNGKNRLLPKDEVLFGGGDCNNNLYYSLPGHTPDSPELLFDNFTIPLHVAAEQQFQIWFAEDLNGVRSLTMEVKHASKCWACLSNIS
ncbi:hypothetical protein OS493_031416 [Desmophyllum pertusum]|uniref:EGF-like domain-containing protein n=1 Tax=Desmophyllum pertusum TaxID=174260 RepID=A0A9W9Y8H5_9CNID|nr:hypothetical protein OS493_031416 [Desmophyllum pertusum]